MSHISSHILDTTLGKPAAHVKVSLSKEERDQWKDLGTEETNNDGRVTFAAPIDAGVYRLIFRVGDYLKGQEAFFHDIPVIFCITDLHRNYHVPLLLNPFGYSTYRGS